MVGVSEHIRSTLAALVELDMLGQLSSVRREADQVVQKVESVAGGHRIFVSYLKRWGSFGDACRRFFGFQQFQIHTIREVVQAALREAPAVSLSQRSVDAIQRAVRQLNVQIGEYNAQQLLRDSSARSIPVLELPELVAQVPAGSDLFHAPVRGISNWGGACYRTASLVALCCSGRFRGLVESIVPQNDVHLLLRMAFQALTKPGHVTVSLTAPPFSDLAWALARSSSPEDRQVLAGHSEQDAHEFMLRLLEGVLGRADLIRYLDTAVRIKGFSSLDALHIPAVDSRSPVESTNIVSIIPSAEPYPLQSLFDGVEVEEEVEESAIISSPRNAHLLTPEVLQGITQEKLENGGSLRRLRVTRRIVLLDPVPPILPIHVNRICALGERNGMAVHMPTKLQVAVVGQPDSRGYDLSSIVVHRGRGVAGGHYVTYRVCDGAREAVELFDDDRPIERRPWPQVAEEIQRNAYLLMYEASREERARPR